MGTQNISLSKRMLASIGVLTMTLLALFGVGAAAQAAPAGEGNIDFKATGSITVHKHAQPETAGEPATGADQGVLPDPLAGVEFRVDKVTNIDLADPSQWDQLENLTPADVQGNLEAVAGAQQTNANGTTTFGGLDVGVYLVTEGEDQGGNNIVRKAEPFLVVIPTAIDNEWTYDLHVYPKNSLTQVSKELDETSDSAAAGAGDIITWNVSATAPQLAPNDVFNELRYQDVLDGRLVFENISEVTYGGTSWTEGSQYAVAQSGQTITMTLTAQGLASVEANQGQELAYKVNTSVAEGVDIGEGVIENDITQFTTINDQEYDFTTAPTETHWGTVRVEKQDADNAKGLGDAEFQIFRTASDAQNQVNAITINGETTFTTGGDGTLNIGPLNAGAENSRDYYLVETKAPSGYQLDDSPRLVTVTAGASTELYVIDNTKQPDFELPLTGAAGTWMFVAAGVGLLLIGSGLYVRNRRKATA
ncbi:SpaH/EbpB family LPXTG-anchored major pilin [Enteractinococcus helveticum]|uniref:Fimbrial protein n=1 Tax=Enteractinococcus helveticum TaxID=1837282 RepID=A0A1B7LVM0_9MICC|nr:SpaH/EbpB family LPXTG-anchored major pilin [Enteractinococcus helveticum]OAV53918.1 hypothetical protein A6F49_00575 [Enteractinococcus helveticum]